MNNCSYLYVPYQRGKMVYPVLRPLMRTPRLPVVHWTDAPADLNGLVRFAERRNLVSARVPLHLKCSLQLALGVQVLQVTTYTLTKRESEVYARWLTRSREIFPEWSSSLRGTICRPPRYPLIPLLAPHGSCMFVAVIVDFRLQRFFTLEVGTDRLSRNMGKELPLLAA